jgi:hypothetical protein
MDNRQTKPCSKCKQEFPNTEEYFHLDKSKVKLGHLIVLAAACKKCKNAANKIASKKLREKHILEYGSTYQKRKLDDPNHLHKCKAREKRYQLKRNERNKKRWHTIPEVKETHKILNGKRNKKEVIEMPDMYIARLITRNSKILKPIDVLPHKNFIETYRNNLKLKRLCNQ